MASENQKVSDFPHLAREFDSKKNHPLGPEDVTAGNPKKLWWRCVIGHSWQAVVHTRTSKGYGCPYCSGKKILSGYNDLLTRYPEIRLTWDFEKNQDIDPHTVAPQSHRIAWFRCEAGHSFDQSVAHYVNRRSCPVCSGRRLIAGINDLETLRPDVANEWSSDNVLKPTDVSPGSNQKVLWDCSRKHTYVASVSSRTGKRPTKCPYCSGQKVLTGFNDMESARPDLAAEFNLEMNAPLTPRLVVAGTSRKLWWNCPEGHPPFQQFGYSRVSGAGCPVCVNRKILAGINDLATTHPELMGEWDFKVNKIAPSAVGPGSHQKAHWVCAAGHRWEAVIKSRSMRGLGCAQCAGQRPVPGETDLATTHPKLLAEWDFERNVVSPSEIIAGTNQKLFWICSDCSWRWEATGNKRALYNQGCPMCQVGGFQISKPSILYFLRHEEYKARKLGITNRDAQPNRLEGFQKDGWRIIGKWEKEDGVEIKKAETALLGWIREDLGLPPYLTRAEMGHAGGWSETFSIEGPSDLEVMARAEESLGWLKKTRQGI